MRACVAGAYNALMNLIRPVRSLVALFTLAALLFCHTATATQAYLASPAGSGAAAAVPPCHGPAGDAELPLGYAPSPCESAQAVGDRVQPVVTAVLLLPARVADFEFPETPCLTPAAHRITGVAGAAPPLHLLHCRLRN